MDNNESPTNSAADKNKTKHKPTAIGEFQSIEEFTKVKYKCEKKKNNTEPFYFDCRMV